MSREKTFLFIIILGIFVVLTGIFGMRSSILNDNCKDLTELRKGQDDFTNELIIKVKAIDSMVELKELQKKLP